MKKTLIFSLVCACMMEMVAGVATASSVREQKGRGCTLGKCLSTGDDCLGTNPWEIGVSTTSPNIERSYMCEKGYCRGGDIIVSKDAEYIFMCIEPGGARNWFNAGNDKWVDYKPYVSECSREQIENLKNKDIYGRFVFPDGSSMDHVRKTIVNSEAGQSFDLNDVRSVISVKNGDICFGYICEYGYVPDAQKKHCIEKQTCESRYSDPDAIACCHAEERGEAKWDGRYCQCNDFLKTWDGRRCIGGGDNYDRPCRDNEERATETMILTSLCPHCSTIIKGQCYDKEMLKCYKAIQRGEPANWNGKICNCGDKHNWDNKSGKCVAKGGVGTCEKYRQQGASQARLNCCYAGSATTWSGDLINGTCTCVDTTKEWDGKKCIAKQVEPDQPVVPVVKECRWISQTYVNCKNGKQIIRGTSFVIPSTELNGKTCEQFIAEHDMITYIRDRYCNDPNYTTDIVLDAKTKKAIDNINAFLRSSEENANVWRNEEGKFNTSRLASDATAAVVLGTVGGVVSAKVIKKKQLEKGYDVLNCTVGGQKMADWGDIFNVEFHR